MNKYITNANMWLNDTGNKITSFFSSYRYVLLISFIIGILINSVDIFTFKFGIDSEIIPYNIQFNHQRYGSLILYNLFPFLTNNIISQIIGIISLIFAALLMVSRHNISNTAKILFIIMFISCSYFTYLQFFFFQSAYNFIGLLLVVAAFRLIENNKNIIFHILAVFLLFIGISSYQSNFSIFLSVMMLNVMLSFINDKNIKKSLILIMKSVLILLLSLAVYYIVIKITTAKMDSYFSNQILWFRDYIDYFKIIINLFYFIIYKNIWFYIYTIIIIMYVIFHFKNINERFFFIFLSILFFLAVYSLNILMGNIMPERARTQLALLPAFTFILLYIFKENNIFKTIAILLSFFAIIINTTHIVQFQVSYKLQYEQDKMTASKLLDIIYTKYPEIYKGKYKLTFYGKLMPNRLYIKQPYFSFYSWDGGNPNRIFSFLRLLGLPDLIIWDTIISWNKNLSKAPKDLKELIRTMPSYPSPDCAQLYKDTVIVKLSD